VTGATQGLLRACAAPAALVLAVTVAPSLGGAGPAAAQARAREAAPVTAYQMPFPCGQSWTGRTRPSHSPSSKAIDWNRADDAGDPVVASAPGVVSVAAVKSSGYGHHVVLDHGDGESSLYAHLDEVSVVAGQRVDQGAQVGTVGSTGNSTGAHLHFEEKVGGAVVDAWFDGAPFEYGATQTSRNCLDVPLAANMLGGPRAELVVFRRGERKGIFLVRRTGQDPKRMRLGRGTDLPLLGDWDGNGKANLGVYRPSTATFLLRAKRGTASITLGSGHEQPVAGDWDGDGLAEVGLRDPATGTWTLRAADGSTATLALGDADDLAVTGDWDGDGRTDIGVFDVDTATFTLRRLDGEGIVWTAEVAYGEPGQLPVPADWDGNGVTDLGTWDPGTARFHQRKAPSPTSARTADTSKRFGRRR